MRVHVLMHILTCTGLSLLAAAALPAGQSVDGCHASNPHCERSDIFEDELRNDFGSISSLSLLQRAATLTKKSRSDLNSTASLEASAVLAPKVSPRTVEWGVHDALVLLQQVTGTCNKEVCKKDKITIVVVTLILIVLISLIFIAFCFFREDKEEQVTPLCPQLVVRDSALTFKIALDPMAEKLEVTNNNDPSHLIAKVAMDWPDPFRPCASGIASTARLQNVSGMNLATVVARNVAVSGQALALCRSGCEIFGFVEPDSANRYHVRHRTGVHLLTLIGDFNTWCVDGVNPAGAVVFSAKKDGDFVVGKVQQHVDAGLLICCVVAAHIHRVLQQPPHGAIPSTISPTISAPYGELTNDAQKEATDTQSDELAISPAVSGADSPATPHSSEPIDSARQSSKDVQCPSAEDTPRQSFAEAEGSIRGG